MACYHLIALLMTTVISFGRGAVVSEANMKWQKIPVVLPFSTYASQKNAIYYHTFIPVLFKFSLPSISTYSSIYSALCDNDEEESPTVPPTCNNETMATARENPVTKEDAACATLRHLSEVFENHEQTHRPWKPLSKLHRSHTVRTDLSSVPCDEILPHFENFKVTAEEFERYEHRLEECHFGHSVITIPEPPVEERAEFEQLLISAKNASDHAGEGSHYDTTPTGSSPNGEPFDLVVAMQQASISHLQLERAKWFEAFSDCRAHLIPTTLVDYVSLATALELANETAVVNTLKFALADLHGYYNLPLSDCVVLEETNFVVRVLMPVLKTEENLQLVRVTSIPSLVYRDRTFDICDSLSADVILLDNSVMVAKACQSSKLCYLDGSERRESYPAHCLLPGVQPARGAVQSCKYQCYKLPPDYMPLIRRSASNRFVIAAGVNATVQVQCDSDVRGSNRTLKFNRTTVMEIVLPCRCELVSRVVHRSVSPCAESSSITVLELEPAFPTRSASRSDYFGHDLTRVVRRDPKEKLSYTVSSGEHQFHGRDELVDENIRELRRDIYLLWIVVIALGSVLAFAVVTLSCFALRMKRMKRDFIKSNDHRSTFYSFTDMNVT